MALGLNRTVKREWSNHTQSDAAVEPWGKVLYEEINAAFDALAVIETLVNELRTDATTNLTFATEVKADTAIVATWEAEVDGDLDTINDVLEFDQQDGVIGGDYTIATQADPTLLGAGLVHWRRAGQLFSASIAGNITLGADGDPAQNKYRAWRIEISDLGAVTAVASGDHDSTTAEQALLRLGTKAKTANTVTIAYFSCNDETGAFDIGTTNTADTENERFDYERMPYLQARHLTAAPSVPISIGTTPEEFAFGTTDVKISGLNVAQIVADTTRAYTNADVITTSGNFGGHLFVTDLAGTAIIDLADDGVFEGASTVDHADLATVTTALDNLQDRLPSMFCVIGRETCETAKEIFTYKTDDLAGTDGTGTYTTEVVTAFDRTNTSGTGIGPTRPTVPGTITAPAVVAMDATAAAAPGSAAADLSGVSKPSTIESGD